MIFVEHFLQLDKKVYYSHRLLSKDMTFVLDMKELIFMSEVDFTRIQKESLDLVLNNEEPTRAMGLYLKCYDMATEVLGSGKAYIKGKDGIFYDTFMVQKICYQNYLLKKEFDKL